MYTFWNFKFEVQRQVYGICIAQIQVISNYLIVNDYVYLARSVFLNYELNVHILQETGTYFLYLSSITLRTVLPIVVTRRILGSLSKIVNLEILTEIVHKLSY